MDIYLRGSTRGSPPRMRGKPFISLTTPSRSRITPAHAGKTADRRNRDSGETDHPRACGENEEVPLIVSCKSGSPPRMRGKQQEMAAVSEAGRITPAHAGKTSKRHPAFCTQSDHPRACGENSPPYLPARLSSGSPPRMRGKPINKQAIVHARRITPAHAGKTLCRCRG